MALIAAVLLSERRRRSFHHHAPREPSPPIEQELHLELAAEGLVNPIAAAVAPGSTIACSSWTRSNGGALTADGLEDKPFLDLR